MTFEHRDFLRTLFQQLIDQPLEPDDLDRRTDESLGGGAEGDWQRLRRQVELGSGFWLGFLFSRSPRIAQAFAARLEGIYRSQARRFQLFRAKKPDELLKISHSITDSVMHQVSEESCPEIKSPSRHGAICQQA